jgi:lipoyl(octanoyl) transferase
MECERLLKVARLGRVDYADAMRLQDAVVAARIADKSDDTLLLLEHPHVFTLGRGGDERFILNPGEVPVHRVSRGGQVTYHGPGQLIGYPILKLEGSERDVLRYLRRLEETIIAALAQFDIDAYQRERLTGVWTGNPAMKIASIGVGFRRWVSLHGFAINVAPDLAYFDAIVPCGIEGCRMTSIAALGRSDVSVDAFAEASPNAHASAFRYSHVEAASAVLTAS